MPRRNEYKNLIERWCEAVRKHICGNKSDRSVFVSVIDKREKKVSAFQVGDECDVPFEHVAYLLSSDCRESIVDAMYQVLDKRSIRELVELITARMDEASDDEEGEEWKAEGKGNDGNVPCQQCALFVEKSMGFGYCRYHKEGFDGLDKNMDNNNGKACKHLEI